jgi:hypothetical protein
MQQMIHRSQISRRLLTLTTLARERGLDIQFRTDFAAFGDAYRQARPNDKMTPIFDAEECDIGAHNGFWLLGRDGQGEIAFLDAARVDRLEQGSLSDHLRETFPLYRPQHMEIDPDNCRIGSPAMDDIGGVVAYHGETWLRPGPDGFRGRGLGRVIMRLGFLTVLAMWAPDYLWAFVSDASVRSGLAQTYGMNNLAPDAALWVDKEGSDELREWLLWAPRSELAALAWESRYEDTDEQGLTAARNVA